ncbi:hypothetical protein HMPREF2141_01919 [Bacteroides uniformis]|nr:hypothetical protein HMPREF2141_01919 [Bacteroides uniformis]
MRLFNLQDCFFFHRHFLFLKVHNFILSLVFLFVCQVQTELGIQPDSILLLVCYRLVLTKTRLRWKSGNTLLDD